MPISILSGILHLDREDLITNRPDFIKRYIYQLKNEICNLSNTVDNEYRWAFIARKIIINAEINGITNDLLIESAFSKLEINKSRKWPDWRTVDENKAIEHLKSKKHSINVGKDNNDKKK